MPDIKELLRELADCSEAIGFNTAAAQDLEFEGHDHEEADKLYKQIEEDKKYRLLLIKEIMEIMELVEKQKGE